MNQTFVENLAQMDISKAGGITHEKTRIDTINHPILVIGLGGTGIDAMLRLKYQVGRRFKGADNIQFLGFETNDHDRKRYKGVALDPNLELIPLSNNGIGSILNNKSTMPHYIKSWLSPDITITDGTKGASGNRQAGRLLLFEKINTTIDAIDGKIRSLRLGQENKLLVFILSGLSGGTGGGMFLDIAYIIRGIMEREYGAKGIDRVETFGYLFTPDVNLASQNLNTHTQEYIQRNGYAALKELDYWMNIEERPGHRFIQQYGSRLTVNSGLAPFNLCHLVSASNVDGVFISGAYDYCMNVAAENILNFLALEEKESGQEFALQDYYSNLTSNIATMKTTLPEGIAHKANFIYNIIGAATAEVPTAQINGYLTHQVFSTLELLFHQHPTAHDTNQFAGQVAMDITKLGQSLTRNLPPIKLDHIQTDYYSYQNVIKTARVDIDEKLKTLYAQAKNQLSNHQPLLTATKEKINQALEEIFIQPTKGPIYTAHMVTAMEDYIHHAIKELEEKISTLKNEADALQFAAITAFETAQTARIFTRIFGKESKKNQYISAKTAIYTSQLQQDIFAALIAIYKDLAAYLNQLNASKYNLFADILTEAKDIFESNVKQPPEANQFTHHIIRLQEIKPAIDAMVAKVGFDTLATNLAKALLDNQEKFLDPNHPDIPAGLGDFIYNQFSSLHKQSMSWYLGQKYGPDRNIHSIIESTLAPKLKNDAKAIFHLDNTAGIFNFPSYGMVSVPANAPDIARGIDSYKIQAGLKFNMRKSSITDRIFWLNTQNGLPLFAFSPLKIYEALYESTIKTREGIGRHLCMTEEENWVNLPSPIPMEVWGDTYQNPRQLEITKAAYKTFADGLVNGIIKLVDDKYTACGRLIYPTNVESEACAHFVRNIELVALVKIQLLKPTYK